MIESIEYYSFRSLHVIARLLPYRLVGKTGAALGSIVFHLTGFRKQITMDNLAHAFPELSEQQRRAIALGAFRNYGTALLEMLWVGSQSESSLLRTVYVTNRDVFDKHQQASRGVIILSAHFGGWESLPQGLRLQLGKPFTMIVQRQRNKRVDAFIDSTRSRWGNITVPMGPTSAKEILRALRDGGVTLVLGDQSAPKESVFVDFFGRPAATHRGAAAFCLRTGCPIIMALLVRSADGTYTTTLEEVDRAGLEGYSEENITELTRRHTQVLEKWIRRYPDHWLWMHKRWKHTPSQEERDAVEEGHDEAA